jgi:hypothetical protein
MSGCVLREYGVGLWIGFNWCRIGSRSSKHGNELSRTIKGKEFLVRLGD